MESITQTSADAIHFTPRVVGVLGMTMAECNAAYGWTWEKAEDPFLGTIHQVCLRRDQDQSARWRLSVSERQPNGGITVGVSVGEHPQIARGQLLQGLGLDEDSFTSTAEGPATITGSTTHRPPTAGTGSVAYGTKADAAN